MTEGIEDFLNIPPIDKKDEETKEITESSEKKKMAIANIDQHDKEAENVRKKAIDAFDDIMTLGKNVEPSKSARMFEVAGQMLKTGLDAINAKADKQLKVAKLKLEAARLRINDETINTLNHGSEVIADRNSLLKQLTQESKDNTVDVVPEEIKDKEK